VHLVQEHGEIGLAPVEDRAETMEPPGEHDLPIVSHPARPPVYSER